MKSQDIYEKITSKVIEQLEKGVIPWRQTWGSSNLSLPSNLITKKEYRGANTFLLAVQGYKSPYWLTFNQAKAKGASIKKGESATPVIFWRFLEKEKKEEGGKQEFIPLIKYYNVFNVEQCEGLKLDEQPIEIKEEIDPIESCEKILMGMPLGMPSVIHGEARAYYSPTRDFINMPKKDCWVKAEEYYSTLFHELTHATGHKVRLNREGVQGISFFGDTVYSKEELIAEMGASYLCGFAGIDSTTLENSAAYIGNWLARLRADNKLLIQSAAQAQKAVDYILQTKFEEEKEE